MLKTLHPVAGAVALLTILAFWTASVTTEILGHPAGIATVKTLVPWGLLVLIPALAILGLSGNRLARRRHGPLVEAKRRRMPLIAANGLLVPSALFLAAKARGGTFDTAFYTVQALELVAGAVNIVLLGLSFRDGLRLSGRLGHRRALPRA